MTVIGGGGGLSHKKANTSRSCFVCLDALRRSQQFFSHVGTLSGYNQYKAEDKVS